MNERSFASRNALLNDAGDAPPVETMRDTDHRHQAVALRMGYRSVAEYAIDELVKVVQELEGRVERLEGKECRCR